MTCTTAAAAMESLVRVLWLPLLILLPTVRGQTDCLMLQESQLGNTSILSTEGLLAEALSGGAADTLVLILESNVVCLGQGTVRDTYHSISVVVRYFAGSVKVVQVEYQCTDGEWRVDSNSSLTFNHAGTLSTELRTDCSLCMKPHPSTGSAEASAEEHCIACASNCTGLMRCAGPPDTACCNYFDMTGSCVSVCPNNSSPSNTTFQCECLPGYMPTASGKNCSEINECQYNPCKNGGTCTDLVDDFSCECIPGFTGDNCTTDIDDCQSNPCENGGNCTDLIADFSCECAPGFTGNNCTSIDDCSPNPCENGGTCTDLAGNFSCSCLEHWSGILCDTCSLPGCANCSVELGQNTTTCSQCINGFRLSGNICMCNIDGCSTCSDSGLCLICEDSHLLTSSSQCEPEANAFPLNTVIGVVVGLVAMLFLIILVTAVGLTCSCP